MLSEAPDGPLHGVPIAVKDMFTLPWRAPRDGAVRNLPASTPGESVVYRRLRDAGAVIVGVTNMHEFGMGSTGHISAYGPSANPWDPARCAGGSSGGSGAAVAARLVAGAVGSDGGGSIRYPASYCGITGLKSPGGSCASRATRSAYSSMGTGGPMCRDAADARLLGRGAVGRPFDAAARDEPAARASCTASGKTSIPRSRRAAGTAVGALRDERRAGDRGRAGGARARRDRDRAALPLEGDAVVQAGHLWRRSQSEVSPVGRALRQVPAPDARLALVARARLVRAQLRRSLARAFEHVDALAWPTIPAPAP